MQVDDTNPDQRTFEGAEGALARFGSPPWGNEGAMSDHDETAADQEERRDDVPPSDPDDERWRMRNPEDESPPNEGGESQQPA